MPSISLLSIFIPLVTAHGYVSNILAAGTSYPGYSPSFQYQSPPPTVAGWSDPKNIENGFISPAAYSSADIICHLSATPGGKSIPVAAGDAVELQWTPWPDSHHGPVLDYIARCPEAGCKGVEKEDLKFVKIAERGMVEWKVGPGKWASDDLIANNNTWSITIPKTLTPGSYVLRHEIIALHSANQENGAQNYPQCVNIDIITSEGTEDLDLANGIPATQFYKSDDPGLEINIYTSLTSYAIPGPTLWSGAASSVKQTAVESYIATSTAGRYTSHVAPTPSPTSSGRKNSSTTPGPSPYSKIEALIDALPSGALTRSVVLPSTTRTGESAKSTSGVVDWGKRPEKELPEGWNLRDLLGWVQFLMREAWEKGEGKERKGIHARDFDRERR